MNFRGGAATSCSIKGLEPGSKPDSEHRIVFMRPHLAMSIVYVIGITLSAILLIGSLVLFHSSPHR